MSKDPEKQKELQSGLSGLRGGEMCELRPMRLAPCRGSNSGSRLRHLSHVPRTLGATVGFNRGGAGTDVCFRKT